MKMKIRQQTLTVAATYLHLTAQLSLQAAVMICQLIMIVYQLIMIVYQLISVIIYQLIIIVYQSIVVIVYQPIVVDVRILSERNVTCVPTPVNKFLPAVFPGVDWEFPCTHTRQKSPTFVTYAIRGLCVRLI